MSDRRLSTRRLEIIKQGAKGRIGIGTETAARLVAEIEALRTERDQLAHAILNADDVDEWLMGFDVAQRVLHCRLCRDCGDELDWTDCVYCDPARDETVADVLRRLSVAPCGVCDGTRGHYESCANPRCAASARSASLSLSAPRR
jgi:hypothetical protein